MTSPDDLVSAPRARWWKQPDRQRPVIADFLFAPVANGRTPVRTSCWRLMAPLRRLSQAPLRRRSQAPLRRRSQAPLRRWSQAGKRRRRELVLPPFISFETRVLIMSDTHTHTYTHTDTSIKIHLHRAKNTSTPGCLRVNMSLFMHPWTCESFLV